MAQLITHTPEQEEKWRILAVSNPSRIVKALGLGPGQTTREGDAQADIFPAIKIVKQIARGGGNGKPSPAWEALIEAGIATVLCKNVQEMVTFLNYLPNMPQDVLENVQKEIQSPYYSPLEALCSATCCTTIPPSKSDKILIAALRKNWSGMMDRLWNEPENTLQPQDSHIPERMVLAQMVIRIIITDPTFLSIFYDPSDLTIPIIARHWRYATNPADIEMTSSLLHTLLYPTHPRHVTYIEDNPPPSTPQLLSRIYLGAGPSPTSSTAKQAKAVMTTLADHLTRVAKRAIDIEYEFATGLINAALKDNAEPELTKAVLKSTPYWNSVFRLMKKLAKPQDDSESDMDKRLRVNTIATIFGTTTNFLHRVYFEYSEDCESLLRIWANENFFGALEETIELLVPIPGMTMQYTRMSGVLTNVLNKNTTPLVRPLGTQFPRWRIIGTLLKHDIERQQAAGPPPNVTRDMVPPSTSNIWDHAAWQSFAGLQSKCFDFGKTCARRGCGKDGVISCKCNEILYCTEACQTKDAKDHNSLICSMMEVILRPGVEMAQAVMSRPSDPDAGIGGLD